MGKLMDLTGKRFGRWIVLSRAINETAQTFWFCQCDCGTQRNVRAQYLVDGRSKSCDCLKNETNGKRLWKHGHNRSGTAVPSREYVAWQHMKARCFDSKNKDFLYYGDRGITVAPEWRDDFTAFFNHIGPCPKGLTLDRIDTDRNYEPGNVRWATWREQRQNQRRFTGVLYKGTRLSIAELAELVNINYNVLRNRLRKGYSPEKAIYNGRYKSGPKPR